MNAPRLDRRDAVADEVARLRSHIQRIERTTRTGSAGATLPAPDRIARLLPGGGLRAGTAYALDRSMPLLTELLAAPSQTGTWCAAIGMPELGIEAAHAAGADLDRLVLIPRPGERWLSVVATVAEVVGLIAVRPGGRVREQDAARIAARLRERGTVLLVQGPWPQAEARLAVEDLRWSGLGDGHGHLERLEATVAVSHRQAAGTRRGRVPLLGQPPAPSMIEAADAAADPPETSPAPPQLLRATG